MILISEKRKGTVWTWLPGTADPVPCGLLSENPDRTLNFQYGRRYLERTDAFALYGLPLDKSVHGVGRALGRTIPGEVQDAAPDGWGKRVILDSVGMHGAVPDDDAGLFDLDYLLLAGSDRIGALDVRDNDHGQRSEPRQVTLEQLLRAAELVENGEPLPPILDQALLHGTSVGGARPKATIAVDGTQYIAKFSSSTDIYPVIGGEAACIYLAQRAGIQVPPARLEHSAGKDVLLMKRFDRLGDGTRLHVVTALTILGFGELEGRYGSYPGLLDTLREKGQVNAAEELFRRVAFNIAIGNTDDHLRNHSAFWNGARLQLTPAYDLSPCPRSGETASQAIAYGRDGQRVSSLASLSDCAADYGLSRKEAKAEIDRVVSAIHDNWSGAVEFARLSQNAQQALWGRQILNPGSVRGLYPATDSRQSRLKDGTYTFKHQSPPEVTL